MCAGTGQRQHQNIIFYAVDKQPVRKNMTFTKKLKKQRPFRVGFTIPEFRCNVQLFSEIPVRQMLQSIHLTIKYALSSNISKV